MAAVTVIRLSGYIGIPLGSALYCRRFNLGVENAIIFMLTLIPRNGFNLVPSGSITSLMSSGNSYTNMVMNQSTLSVSLIKHHSTEGVKTASKQHFSLFLPNQKLIRNMPTALADRAPVTVIHSY